MIQIFHYTKDTGKILNKKCSKTRCSRQVNVLFISHNSEEIKLSYKSSYNKRKTQVILLMINDEVNNYYYFAIKNLSELNSLGWLRGKKKAIININNNYNNNFQTIESNPQRISKLKPYINKYNWKGINFPATPKDWKKFELNNKTIALNLLYIPHSTKTSNITEYNNKSKKQVILLVISNGEKQHHLAVTNLSA